VGLLGDHRAAQASDQRAGQPLDGDHGLGIEVGPAPVTDQDQRPQQPMSDPTNKALVAEFIDALFTRGELEAVDRYLVAERFTARGTHQGELLGVAPTGREVVLAGINIFRVQDGKVVERWGPHRRSGLPAAARDRPSACHPDQPRRLSGRTA
jgi:predicted SnoaL-like aldol condensation-catalyzing enzyme